jgi:hypothetical protein
MKTFPSLAHTIVTVALFSCLALACKKSDNTSTPQKISNYFVTVVFDGKEFQYDKDIYCQVAQSTGGPEKLFQIVANNSDATFVLDMINSVSVGKASICGADKRNFVTFTTFNPQPGIQYISSYDKWTRKTNPGGCVDYGCCDNDPQCGNVELTIESGYTGNNGSNIEGSLSGSVYYAGDLNAMPDCPNAKPHDLQVTFRLKRTDI